MMTTPAVRTLWPITFFLLWEVTTLFWFIKADDPYRPSPPLSVTAAMICLLVGACRCSCAPRWRRS